MMVKTKSDLTLILLIIRAFTIFALEKNATAPDKQAVLQSQDRLLFSPNPYDCSRKKVKVTQFCILYDTDHNNIDDHQIQLNGGPHYPKNGFVQWEENKCHTLPHHVPWEKMDSHSRLSVGTKENNGKAIPDDFSRVFQPSEWYLPTCEPYHITFAIDTTHYYSHQTSSCWDVPDPSGCGTCTRCGPDWKPGFQQSFQFKVLVEPDIGTPDCSHCPQCTGCPQPPPYTYPPTLPPTYPPTTPQPTLPPTKPPTALPITPPPTCPHCPCPTCPPVRKEYYIINTNTGKYLDYSGARCENGNNVYVRYGHRGTSQRWYDGPHGTIMSASCPGMALTMDDWGNYCYAGTNVSLRHYEPGAPNQKFAWHGYELFNPQCNVALDTDAYGHNVRTWQRVRHSHQCWVKQNV